MANANVTLGAGAGVQSGQLVAEKGVEYLLAGNCGPNAYRTLEAAGIKVVTGCSGTVRQVVEGLQSGAWTAIQQPNVDSHFGMGQGRGMGRGRGIGMGQGPEPEPPSSAQADQEELSALKQEATDVGQRLKSIQQRIRELEAGG